LDIKKYISSGILELYVLGAASEQEMQEVESLAAKHQEIRDEIEAIRSAVEGYARAHVKSPSSGHRQQVMAELDRLADEENKTAAVIRIDRVTKYSGESRVFSNYKWAVAASLLLFLVSAALNVILYDNLKTANDELADLQEDNLQMADEFGVIKVLYNDLLAEWKPFTNPDSATRFAILGNEELAQDLGTNMILAWNEETSEVRIFVNSASSPAEEKTYVLWAIAEGADVPINIGFLNLDTDLKVPVALNAVDGVLAFALSIESDRMVQTPTNVRGAAYLL
jgi:anti-sigma-K factor RskA